VIDRSAYGLHRAAVREFAGLVFVWLDGAGEPAPFEEAARELCVALAPQGLCRARVAHQIDYDVAANWKLVWQNNRECWHCHAGHPEYVRANFDAAPDTARFRALALRRAHDHADVLGRSAAVDEHARPGLYGFPSQGRWWSANRTPLQPGFVTESLDGGPVAPLMGDYAGYDIGTLRVRALPSFWIHASADHAVVTRLAPAGVGRTAIRVQWLVDRDARASVDYALDRLLPFWQLTSKQGWDICERNQAGVENPAFTPGPYSPEREYNVIAFDAWYMERMGRIA
jgi:Rieske 2Fe-2S family protein